MKLIYSLIPFLLSFIIISCDSNDDEPGISNNSKVTINENGTTSTGAVFSVIDNETFYLDYIKYKIVDSHLEIVGYDPYELKGDVRPYALINYKGCDYNTKVIGSIAFRYCKEMSSFSMPSTIEKIGSGAFLGCESLTSMKLPFGIEEIQGSTFANCYSLKTIDIPNSVTSIHANAFSGCTSLVGIELPQSLKVFYLDTFNGCQFKSIVIPSNVENIIYYKTYTDLNIEDVYTSCKASFEDYNSPSSCSSYSSATLHVPSGEEAWYRSRHDGWSQFETIVGDYNP